MAKFPVTFNKMPNNLIAVGRSKWFSISVQHAKYIVNYLQENEKVKRFFELKYGSDEFVFQTILFNSIHQKDMVNDNLRYIDWTEQKASPKTFTIDDLPSLLGSGKLFGRKFSERIDNAILKELDKQKG